MSRGKRLFIKQAFSVFGSTGAVFPSSRYLARAMAGPLEERRGCDAVRVLEVGPGTGPFTRRIHSVLRPRDTFDVVELNPEFVGHLERWAGALGDDGPPVVVHHCDINEFEADDRYDVVISGLPFNNFPPDLVDSIFGRFEALARPGAPIVFFQYIAIRHIKSVFAKREDRERVAKVGQVIDRWVSRYGVSEKRVFLNLPPASVHRLEIGADGASD